MKTWRRIKRNFEELVGNTGLDKLNGANIIKYVLNLKDGRFTWEEKKVLNHLFSQMIGMKTEDMNKFNLTQNECDVFRLSQVPTSYAKWDEDWNVTEFILYMPRIEKVEYEDGTFYFKTDDDYTVLFDEDCDYDRTQYGKLIRSFGPHWSAVKAGLRGWYLKFREDGLEGFERKPTNF